MTYLLIYSVILVLFILNAVLELTEASMSLPALESLDLTITLSRTSQSPR